MVLLVLAINKKYIDLVDGSTGEILESGSVFAVADYIRNHFEDGNFLLEVI